MIELPEHEPCAPIELEHINSDVEKRSPLGGPIQRIEKRGPRYPVRVVLPPHPQVSEAKPSDHR